MNQVALARRQLPVLAGITLLIALWIIGGRLGWADGMVVTPAEAIRPLTAERSREVYLRATGATAGAAGKGLLIGSVDRRSSPRWSPRRCPPCVAASPVSPR